MGNSFHSRAIMNGRRQVNCVGPYLSWAGVPLQRCDVLEEGQWELPSLFFRTRPFFLSFDSFLTPGTLAVQAPSSDFDLPLLPTRILSVSTSYTQHPPPPPSSTNQLQLIIPCCWKSQEWMPLSSRFWNWCQYQLYPTSCRHMLVRMPPTSWPLLSHRKTDTQSSHVEKHGSVWDRVTPPLFRPRFSGVFTSMGAYLTPLKKPVCASSKPPEIYLLVISLLRTSLEAKLFCYVNNTPDTL